MTFDDKWVEALFGLAMEHVPLHETGWVDKPAFRADAEKLIASIREETARACAEEAERWDHRAARDIRAKFGVE